MKKNFKMTTKSGKSVCLQAVKMIDPAKSWIEIRTVPSAQIEPVSNQVELAQLTDYPLPSTVIEDRGNKFLVEFREINLCIFKVQNIVLDDRNSLDGILASTMFALRSTVHTT